MTRVRVGTRGSALALVQTEIVVGALRRLGAEVVVERIRTAGDSSFPSPSTALGTGVFVKELEAALLGGRIDLAVHSAKDLPTAETPGLAIAAYLERGDPRDALVSRTGVGLADLPRGGRVGTDSPRRAAFLLAARPDLVILPIRGNVDTRLRKLDAGEYDAVALAAAGLRRLGLEHRITEVLPPDVMLTAAGQGAIAVQARSVDPLVARLDHLPTRQEVVAERAMLRTVGGGCRAPIATLARSDGRTMVLDGAVITPDGRTMIRDRIAGDAAECAALGAALGETLLARGASALVFADAKPPAR